MDHGGTRKGAGRKSIAEEVGTRDLAQKAIIAKWGSLEAGLKALLDMQESVLTKFVFEHAIGKPTDELDVKSGGEVITQQEVIFKDYSKK